MKRMLIILCAMVLAASTVAAQAPAGNRQKIYPIDCEEYRLITRLYLARGLALPSTSGPWSADELDRMLRKIDASTLTGAAAKAYTKVSESLAADPPASSSGLGFRFGLKTQAEGYWHSNPEDFGMRADWLHGFRERSPFFSMTFETWPAENFYGWFEFPFGLGPGIDNAGTGNSLYAPAFGLNLPVSMDSVNNLDFNIPYRAFFAFGDEHWSFQAGRDRLSWGAGETGNLMLGDTMKTTNFLRFATYFDNYKFTTVASFYTHPGQVGDSSQNSPVEGYKMFLGHRMEFRFLEGRLGLALSESLMYQSATGTLDIRVLNPLAVFHNYYTRGNSNSLLSLEADWAVLPGLDVYAQAALDDFPLPGEPVEPAALANPNADGFLAGMKGALPLGPGIFSWSAEYAHTDPFLYLREKYKDGQYGVGYDVTTRVFTPAGLTYLTNFIGYGWGNDALVGDLKASYEVPDGYLAKAEAMYMLHGVMGIDSLWNTYSGTETVPVTPSTQNPFESSAKDSVSKTLILRLSGEWKPTAHITVSGGVDEIVVWNRGNVAGAPCADTQVHAGIAWTL